MVGRHRPGVCPCFNREETICAIPPSYAFKVRPHTHTHTRAHALTHASILGLLSYLALPFPVCGAPFHFERRNDDRCPLCVHDCPPLSVYIFRLGKTPKKSATMTPGNKADTMASQASPFYYEIRSEGSVICLPACLPGMNVCIFVSFFGL